jgi:hypothetical protein
MWHAAVAKGAAKAGGACTNAVQHALIGNPAKFTVSPKTL